MAICKTKHQINFADGVHGVGEAIELNSEEAQAVLKISDADLAQLLSIGAIELPVITDPVVADPVVIDPVVADQSTKKTKTTKATK